MTHGDWLAPFTFNTAQAAAPAAPQLAAPPNAAENMPTVLTLNWAPSPGALDYNVQVARDGHFTLVTVNDEKLTDTSDTIPDLLPGARYWWRVRASNGLLWGALVRLAHLTVARSTALAVPPGQPTLQGLSGSNTATTLLWGPVPGARSYLVQIATDTYFAGISVNRDGLTAPTLTLDRPLQPSTQYWWRVKAENAAGWGMWSLAGTFTTPALPVPTLLAPADGTGDSAMPVHLMWNPLPGAAGCRCR